MAAPALYQLVDELATSLDHGVVIGSRDFRLVAHSAHQPGVDAVRRASILSRRSPAGVPERLRGMRLDRTAGPVRIPRFAELGMTSRLGVAIRHRSLLLGYLWVVLGPGEVSGRQLALVGRAAVTAGELMFADEFLEGSRRAQHSGWLQGLLGDEAARTVAIAELAAHGFDTTSGAVTVVGSAAGLAGPDLALHSLAADRARLGFPPESVLAVGTATESVLVLAGPAERLRADAGRAATALLASLRAVDGRPDTAFAVGVGEVVTSAARARTSYEQALGGIALARARGDSGVVRWAQLGVDRAMITLAHSGSDLVSPALRRIMAEPDHDELVSTLASFLDHAGNVARVAAELHLHRATVYRRLARIEEAGGVRLDDGTDRLDLHVSLRLLALREG